MPFASDFCSSLYWGFLNFHLHFSNFLTCTILCYYGDYILYNHPTFRSLWFMIYNSHWLYSVQWLPIWVAVQLAFWSLLHYFISTRVLLFLGFFYSVNIFVIVLWAILSWNSKFTKMVGAIILSPMKFFELIGCFYVKFYRMFLRYPYPI